MKRLEHNIPFPSFEEISEEGIIAFGGELTTKRLIEAYSKGIFPWYGADEPVLWWCPDPRFVLFREKLHLSKRVRKLLKEKVYRVTYDQRFEEVMRHCATVERKGQHGTWIHPEMIKTYTALHRKGIAHSVEVWQGEELVGGLYGIRMGAVFCGESMFSLAPNASEYGFITMLEEDEGISMVDCQVYSAYLERLGAEEVPRDIFLLLFHLLKG